MALRTVRQMEQYIPAIQDVFRRNGFQIERAGKVQQVTFGPCDGAPVQVVEQQRWEYRNREKTWNIIVMQDSVILQTTAYTRFEAFAERLKLCVHTVLAESEQDRFGVVQRVGLRYVDIVRPRSRKGYRFYLRPGLHGLPDEVYQLGRHLVHVESRGNTVVGGDTGTMVVRVVQNDQGLVLPPDLLAAAPKFSRREEAAELVTVIDMDHYVEGNFNPDSEWVVARAYEMHDHIIETFHEHVVTSEAIEEWK
ncbi:MAG: TIGR04255 family protein [Gammaproteobacteria bacterium]|nr:TIGR04255 family protein [Gammaproteobacteria bacterium]